MKYLLYIGPLQDIPAGITYSYYDSNRRRMFVLAEEQPKGKFAPVPEDLLCKLDAGEKQWYNASCWELNQKWLLEHKEEAVEQANILLDLFAEELRAEAEKLKEKGDGNKENEAAE